MESAGGMESSSSGAMRRSRLLAAHLRDTLLQLRLSDEADPCASEEEEQTLEEAPKYAAEYRASAFVLAFWSPFFAAALSEEWGGETKRLVITAEPGSFEHLLEFMHSMGKAMPEGVLENARLLATAHEFGVEECIEAAVVRLAAEVEDLSWEQADKVLDIISGAACEDTELAAALASLQQAVLRRLLSMLGNLDAVINDPPQLERFCRLSLVSLEALLSANELDIACEETAFCAFAHWAHSYRTQALGRELLPEERVAAAARILPHIRFATMQPTSVVNYFHAYQWFRAYDADKEILVEALLHMADPLLWMPAVRGRGSGVDKPVQFVRRASCRPQHELEFVAKIPCQQSNDGPCMDAARYWAGYWWTAFVKASTALKPEEEQAGKSGVGVHLKMSLPPGVCQSESGLVGKAAAGPVVSFKLSIGHFLPAGPPADVDYSRECRSGAHIMFRVLKNTKDAPPADSWGCANWTFKLAMPDGSPIRWNNFNASGSPVVRDGKMWVKVAVTQQAAAPAAH